MILFFFITFFSFFSVSYACTSAYHSTSNIMVKSYDWHDQEGYLYFNPKDRIRHTFPIPQQGERVQGKRATWTSKYASITFNQYGRGFPNGGLNEMGLAIEVLWLPETIPPQLNDHEALNELEWVQYHLDTQSTVQGVVAASKKLRIYPIHGKVHYLACDAHKSCATFELINGQLIIHQGKSLPYPALTNHTYESSLEYSKKFTMRGEQRVLPKGRGSLARFTQAATLTIQPQKIDLNQALKYLKNVEIKGYTRWQIAYNLDTLSVHFKTPHHKEIGVVHLKNLIDQYQSTERCSSPVGYGLHEPRPSSGELLKEFRVISSKEEEAHLKNRLKALELPLQLASMFTQHSSICEESQEHSKKLNVKDK